MGNALRSLGAVVFDPAHDSVMAARLEPEASGKGVVILVDHAHADAVRERLSGNGDRDVALVSAPNVAAMISAAAEFHPGASPADNAAGMAQAAARIRAAELAANETEGVVDLVAELADEAPDAEVLTLVAGTRVTDGDLAAATSVIARRFPALRIETLRGPAATPAFQIGLE